MSRLLTILPAALLVLSGCSDDEPAPPAPTDESYDVLDFGPRDTSGPYDAGLARLYAGDNPLPQDVDESRCFTKKLRGLLDDGDLETAGIVRDGQVVDTLPVFDPLTAETWVDAELDCVSYVDAATRAFLVQSKGAVDADEFQTCLKDAISDEQVRAALVDLLSGDYNTAEVETLTTTQADCASTLALLTARLRRRRR